MNPDLLRRAREKTPCGYMRRYPLNAEGFCCFKHRAAVRLAEEYGDEEYERGRRNQYAAVCDECLKILTETEVEK